MTASAAGRVPADAAQRRVAELRQRALARAGRLPGDQRESGRVRIEVTDQHGSVAEVIDRDALLGQLPARKRAKLDDLADRLVRDVAGILGCAEDHPHARALAIAEVTRMAADEAAYQRVAEQRGLLPL